MHKSNVLRRNGERGQSLIEFAFGLMILLILVAGAFDVSRAVFTYLALRDAAQEGALYASIDPTNNAEIIDRACNASNLLIDLCNSADPDDGSGFEITITPTDGQLCMGDGNGIEVIVDYPNFPLSMPLIGELVGSSGTIPITASIIDTIIRPSCTP